MSSVENKATFLLFCSHSGILSAFGLALADVVHEAQEPCSCVYGKGAYLSATSPAGTGVAAFSNAIILGDPGAVRRGEGT